MVKGTPKDGVEKTAEKIAQELQVVLPASGLPLLIRLIALFTLIGGLSIIGGIFADIVKPPSATPHFYFLRIVVGSLSLAISYGIIERQRWALWLYAVVVLTGLFVNPVVAILPMIILIYLFSQREQFMPSILDLKLESLKNSLSKKHV